MKRISILVPTYQRNNSLRRIIGQYETFLCQYNGPNTYELCIADSDRDNPVAESLAHWKYSVNPGEGFDDNLFSFWKDSAACYDYVFSISDDDVFMVGVNPLYLLDAAASLGVDAVMFNNRNFITDPNGQISLGSPFYPDLRLSYDHKVFLQTVLTLLPRHIGLFYSSRLLTEHLEILSRFRETLHLYAAPLILAGMKKQAVFLDYTLCLFNYDPKADGAWTRSENVLNGLALFLKRLKSLLPQEHYAIAENGFFKNYLGEQSWLRAEFSENSRVMSVEEIRVMLAQPD